MIKIITSISIRGGSTIASINLAEAFNHYGYECKFYGPHDWHLTQSKYCDKSSNITLDKDDIVLFHYINCNKRLPVKKFILTLHEKELYDLKKKPYIPFDNIHCVSESQMNWHNLTKPYAFVIPNILDDLKPNNESVSNVAGIIGSIDKNKQTHISIQRALQDGMNKIILYGTVNDQPYYNQFVKPLIDQSQGRVVHGGYIENKQLMYDSISDVYQDSASETWGYIARECFLTNTKFHGNDVVPEVTSVMSNEEIMQLWINLLGL